MTAFWQLTLVGAVTAVVAVAARYLRARPVMTGFLTVEPAASPPVDLRLHHRRRVTHRLGGGTLRVTSVRANGTAAMKLVWTSTRGTTPPKLLDRDNHLMIAGMVLRHHEEP